MRYSFPNTSSGYSIILSLVMIGFLLVLTAGTLNLVLQEMQDGRGKQNYLKASAAAEGALEIALSHIKNTGYGYYDILTGATLLGTRAQDPIISYDFQGRVATMSGVLEPFQTEMIPLFWIDASQTMYSVGRDLTLNAGNDISWNMLSYSGGISGLGDFNARTETGEKKLVSVSGNIDFSFEDSIQVGDFLSTSSGVYLILYNTSDLSKNYTLSSTSGFFTEPESTIVSSAKIGNYTQNLKTNLNNTEFLGILKYSIYSGE